MYSMHTIHQYKQQMCYRDSQRNNEETIKHEAEANIQHIPEPKCMILDNEVINVNVEIPDTQNV